jgi:uncharacterized SAM-binding protein YcdF (DUF218 family)
MRALFPYLARGLAGALGLFALFNVVADLFIESFDLNLWWIDLRVLPTWLADLFVAGGGVLLLLFAWRSSMGPWRRRLTRIAIALLIVASLWDAAAFWGLLALGTITSGFPLPFSLLVAAGLFWLYRSAREQDAHARQARPHPKGEVPEGRRGAALPKPRGAALRKSLAFIAAFLVLPLLFPLTQIFLYGKTSYQREADVVVVLGAAVWPGNRPSHALSDRVNTGIRLYKEGLVRKILFSGGPSDRPDILHEVEVMRRMALDAGVPDEDIVLDPDGINTQETVNQTAKILADRGWDRVLAVSHFYHLPRIKMAYARAGIEVYTVPAEETHVLLKLPYYLAREVAALWLYYLRPLWEAW